MRLVAESDRAAKSVLFKEGRDANLSKGRDPLPGADTHQNTTTPLATDRSTRPAEPLRVGYRSLDRQWVLPDHRVMDMPRRDLWEARIPGQVFTVEQHTKPIKFGPGLVFSALIPDFHHFKGSEGGRVLPLLHPDGSPNVAPGLLQALSARLDRPVTGQDLLAYVAGLVAHPAFTRAFADELATPGIRIPLTIDPELWSCAVRLGEQVLWLRTYGGAFAGSKRPAGAVRYPKGDPRQPLSLIPIGEMPEVMTYDADARVLSLGDGPAAGTFGPVTPAAWGYAVDGKSVLKSWFNYRKAVPGGKKTSPLDPVHVDTWDPSWTTELIDLLTVLTRLVSLEPAQADLLAEVLTRPVHTMEGLRAAGVRWPQVPADRRPRRGFGAGADGGADSQETLDL